MNSIPDLVSTKVKNDCRLHPLEEGQVVEFRLKRANQVDHSSTKKVRSPAGHYLAGKMLFRDPVGGQKILLQNITSFDVLEDASGKDYFKPVSGYLEFGSTGSIFCTQGDENKLWFARVNNKNGSNPHRDKKAPVIFYEVDEAKEISLAGNFLEYVGMAMSMLSGVDDAKIMDIATKIEETLPARYGLDFDFEGDENEKGMALLKQRVFQTANTQPIDFLMSVKEPASYARLVVDHLIATREVIYDKHPNQMAWKFRTGVSGKDLILKTTSEKTSKKELIEFLIDPSGKGNKQFMQLTQMFEAYYLR